MRPRETRGNHSGLAGGQAVGAARATSPIVLSPSRAELPAMFRAADRISTRAQRRLLRSTEQQLVLLVVAAVSGTFTWKPFGGPLDWAGVIAVAAFIAAAVLRADNLRSKPEQAWQDGRMAAESIKTLSWRYAVGGEPFAIELPVEKADALFIGRLRETFRDLRGVEYVDAQDGFAQITDAMRGLRRASLVDRKRSYELGRITEQQAWYAGKAKSNRRQAVRWSVLVLAIELFGAIAAILKATSILSIDVLGITSAVIAGLTAWTQARQYETLARTYSIASFELSSIKELLRHVSSERAWAAFIDESEDAISREHTLWRASRSAD
jgi:hypothetical protein